jgi:hypothetical protein
MKDYGTGKEWLVDGIGCVVVFVIIIIISILV